MTTNSAITEMSLGNIVYDAGSTFTTPETQYKYYKENDSLITIPITPNFPIVSDGKMNNNSILALARYGYYRYNDPNYGDTVLCPKKSGNYSFMFRCYGENWDKATLLWYIVYGEHYTSTTLYLTQGAYQNFSTPLKRLFNKYVLPYINRGGTIIFGRDESFYEEITKTRVTSQSMIDDCVSSVIQKL